MTPTDQLVGIPYVLHGRGREGCDCWGLVWLAFRDLLNIDVPSFADESRRAGTSPRERAALIAENIDMRWLPVLPGCEQFGDVVLMHRGHVGFVLSRGLMLHSTRQIGHSVIERYDGVKHAPSVKGFYRFEACS